MEIDLDDLEFDNDKIKNYLNNKLKEIKSRNESLLKTLGERENYSKSLVQASLQQRSRWTVDATICWKKIFNGKYSLGYRLENTTNRKFNDYRVFLRWDSKQPLNYTCTLFEDNASVSCNPSNCRKITPSLSKTEELLNVAYLVVTFKLPTFLDKTTYEVSGNVQFKYQEEDVVADLPVINVSTKDITDRITIDWSVIDGDFKNLLTLMCTAEETDLILILPPEWKSTLESTFEIHCSFTAIDMANHCKTYFYSKRISPILDDVLLEIHTGSKMENELNMRVYTRNAETALHLLHHLYSSIQDVVVIPKVLHQNYLLKQKSTCHKSRQQDEDQFKDCVNKEIDQVERYFQSNCSENYNHFRDKLASLEQETDLVYLKLHRQETS